MATLSYSLNGAAEVTIDLAREKRGEVNVAADGKPDVRFLAWCKVGKAKLVAGENTIKFRMTSANNNHGYLDCFVFSTEPFQPRGLLKPDQLAADTAREAAENKGWFAFDPKPDTFAESPIDLRFLNEKFAGEHGFIGAKDGQFIHTANGQAGSLLGGERSARRGPRSRPTPPDRPHARQARRQPGPPPRRGLRQGRRSQPGLRQAGHRHRRGNESGGIYTHLSIYFPLWFTPRANHPWLEGYDGKTHPFAALMFNPKFQEKYREWWKALLTTPSETTGKALIDEPALFGVEMQNEDSFFFWTFGTENIPDAQLRILETQFGDWLKKKYGSLDAAFAAWKGAKVNRDAPAEGRVSFRPLWNMFNEKTPRDQDTAAFLFELQNRFYAETTAFLRQLGFKGLITPLQLGHRQPGGFRPAGETQLCHRRLHRPPRLLRVQPQGRQRRLVDSRTVTPTPTAAPCASRPANPANRNSSFIR